MPEMLDARRIPGLASAEVARRLASDGPNELASQRSRGVLAIAWEVLREPMLLLLVAAGTVNLVISSIRPQENRVAEAGLLFAFVVVVIGITMYQERKTERALDALKDLSSPRALVVRDGAQRRIAGRDVVRGDIMLLAEGDRVPADAVLLECSNLSVDESLLTGESVPVRKAGCGPETGRHPDPPGGDGTPWVFSGTLVVRGQGIAEVVGTGAGTELGRIGTALRSVVTERTPLQREVDRLVRRLAALGLGLAAAVVIVYGLTRGDWLDGTLAGITLAMAMLPEEFPVVLTVFLALGAWRLSRREVLTRRMPAIETLGSATVLCSDKTGTITQNRMRVSLLWTSAGDLTIDDGPLPEEYHELVEFAVLASPVDPFDPMDTAFKVLGERYLAQTEHLHADWTLVREYPLEERLLALSHVWRSPRGGDHIIAAKGAPEAVADLCHLGGAETAAVEAQVARMAGAGLRVLGVAAARFGSHDGLPDEQHDFEFEFLGLMGLMDPIRADVPEAVRQARRAGMRVVMITGDYPGTATSIARAAGLDLEGRILTGVELDRLGDEEFSQVVRDVTVFARVVPEQKLRIVRALKAAGEVVAMTGDGVNDAPALKAADIGIAMGQRGTDVAREASALVLTDDAFTSIVGAVRSGRRIYDNLKKAMAYILAVHIPIAGMSLLPVILPKMAGHEMPLVLLPVHIAFLELIIDPACSVVFEAEPEEPDVMERAPRRAGEPMFSGRMLVVSLVQGAGVFLAVAAVYLAAMLTGLDGDVVRSLTFTTLVVANLGLIFSNRSWTRTILGGLAVRNDALWWVAGGTILMLAVLHVLGPARSLFRFGVAAPSWQLAALLAGVVSLTWFEAFKLVNARRHRNVA